MKNLNLLNFKSAVRRKARWLITLIAILTLGVGQMWAADASSANIYYDNSSSSWGNVQILIGHSTYSSVYGMTKLTNSNQLYYKRSFSWGGYSEFYFVTGCGSWGNESNSPTARTGYASGYSGKLTTNVGSKTWLFISSGSSNGSSVTVTDCGTDYNNLNYTYTVDQKLSNNGGSSYSASTASLATVKVSSYKLASATATSATANDGTISSGNSSANCKAVRTATVTYSVADVATGYHFLGWYDGDTQKSTSATFSDLWAVSNTTITARFTQSFPVGDKIYLLRNSTWKNASGLNHYAAYFYGKNSAEQWVSCTQVGTSDYYYVEVPSGDWRGVIFVALNNASNNWSYKIYQTDDLLYDASHNGVEITGGNNSQSRITVYTGISVSRTPTAAANAPTITNSQTVVKSGSSVTINAQTEKTGYQWVNWTKTSGTLGTASNKSTTFTPSANNASAVANYSEKTYSLTFSHNGHGSIAVGGATVSSGSTASVNHFTTKTLVATPADGYEFTGWTLSGSNTSAVTIASTSSASTTIKATATGATITAGFARSICPAPTFTAGSTTATGTTFTVTDAENINDYEFYVSTSSTAPTSGTSATYTSTSKTKDISNLYAGTRFYAWVRANCGGGRKTDWTALSGSYFTTSTVTVTHTLTNVTKSSGGTTAGGSDYTAVYAPASGYSMPTPSVTIGGSAATSGTDYTWNSSTKTLTIPQAKITGNIVITLTSSPSAPSSVSIGSQWLWFAGESFSLSVTVTGGNGPKTYQWYKGGTAEGNKITGATSATYSKTFAYEDAGSYYCKVTCGGTKSKTSGEYVVKTLRLWVNGSKGGWDYGNVDFTKVNSTTATANIRLGLNWTYGFSLDDGCGTYFGNTGTMTESNHTSWTMTGGVEQCGLTTSNSATYTFTVNYSNMSAPVVSVTYPIGNQAASKTIYFDNCERNWTNVWYRIGRTNHSSATQMTKVYGTANLYKVTTTEYNTFSGWQIANAKGDVGSGKSIYNTVNSPAVTNATAYEGGAVTETSVTVTPKADHSTGETSENNNCEFYDYAITSGMKTDRVTITAPSNGTITVSYTNTSNASASFTSGYADLAHTCIITPTGSGSTGYHLSGLTVNGAAHTSGNTYTVTGTTTVAATFAENTYNLTFTHNGHGTIQVDGVTVAAGGTAAVNHFTTKTLVATPATGYYFTGWTVSGTNAAAVTIANTSNASTTIKATNTGATVTANFAPIWRIAFEDTYGGTAWDTDLYPINNLAANGSGHLVGTVTRSNLDGHPHTSINFKVFNAKDNKWYGVNSKGYGPNGATNTGSTGSTIAPNYNESYRCAYLVRNGGSNIAFTTAGCGTYTFTWDTTDYKLTVTYPTTVQINANAYKKDIDNNITQSTIGGTISSIVASCSGTLSSMQYYSGSSETMTVTHSTPTTGYTWVGWYSNSGNPSTQWTAGANVTINDGARTIALTNRTTVTYANGLFQETPTTITLNSTAGGHIEHGGATVTSINVGVTTTRTVTAVAEPGYYFTGWTTTTCTDYSVSSTSTAETTITGGGAGTSGQVLTANFALRWTVTGNTAALGDWTTPGSLVLGNISTTDGVTTGYVEVSLAAHTSYEIKMYDKAAGATKLVGSLTDVSAINYSNSGTAYDLNTYPGYNFKFLSAGAGTYRITRDMTNNKVIITYPTAYKVTYGGNGKTSGSVPVDPVYYGSGETVTVLGNTGSLAKTGYTFDGWNTSQYISGTARAVGSTFTISANVTLYAKWKQTVTLHDNNGGSHNGSATAIYKKAGPFTPTAPTRTGYTVEGYYAEEGCTNKVMTNTGALVNCTDWVTSSKWTHAGASTLYTKWTANPYTITLNGQSPTSAGTTSIAVTYDANTNLTSAITKPTKDGYTFQGYYTGTGGSGTQIINSSGNVIASVSGYTDASKNWKYADNITLYAKWTQNITLNQNGATTNGTTSLAAVYNATLSAAGITNPSKTNYTFAGWTNGSGGSGSVVITSAKAVNTVASWTDSDKKWIHAGTSTLYAKWTENTHTVTVAKDPAAGGTTNVSSVSGVGVATASGTITATANPGYYFTGWTIPSGVTLASGTTSSASITINATADSKTITANFAPVWTVACDMDSWSTSAHQITNITASAGSMVSGYVDITLAANTDYEFKLVNLQTDVWWGSEVSNNEINYANRATAKDLAANGSGGTNNQKLRTATAGTYRFTWDVSSSEVTVTYPHTAYKISMSFGTEPTVGSFTATTLAANAVGGTISSAVGSVTGALQVDGAHGTQYVKTGETVVFTHSAAASGYTWDKWGSSYVAASRSITAYTAGTYVAIDDAAGTLTLSNITTDKSVYSFFKENATTITINTANANYGDLKIGGAASSWGTSIDLGATTTKTIKGEGKNGYMFTTWALTGAATKASGYLTDQQISIKGNGTGGSTGTATATFAPGYVIRGSLYDDSGNGGLAGWDNTTAILTPNLSTGVGTYTATLQRGKRYKFKVYFMEGSGYWRGTSEVSDISSGTTYTLPDGGNNITFTAGANGTYTFNYNFSTKELTVLFPTAYSVTYHGNGSTSGSVPTDATPYASGETVNVQGNTGSLAKSNYTLSGWNTTEHITGTTYSHAGGDYFTITANTNLYAKWTQTITLDRNSGTTGSTTATATYNCNTLTGYTAPTRTGYTFAGYWTSETSDNGSGTLVIDTEGALQANVSGYTGTSGYWTSTTARTLYAKWTENSYSVTFYNGGHGTVQVAGATISNGGTATITQVNSKTLAATASTGYDFNGWTKTGGAVIANTSNASTSITATATGTVTANWTAHSYTISYDLAGGSVATPNPTSYTIESSAITLNNPTRTGYTFAGWTGTGLGEATTTVTIAAGSTGNRSYTATWTVNSYTITFNSDGGSAVASITQNYGTAVSAPANPTKTGYTFAGWDPAVPSTMPAENTTCVAQWTADTYTVTLDRNSGTTGATSVTMTYNSSTMDGYTAPTRTGYTFKGYYTSESSNNGTGTQVINTSGTLQANVDGYTGAGGVWIRTTATTLYAKWTQKTYAITFYNGGHGTVAYNGNIVANGATANVYHVSTKSLVATGDPGYDFAGWTKGGTNASKVTIADASAASTTIKATATNASVTANWTAHSYSISYDLAGGSVATPNPTSYTIESSAITLNNPTRTGYTFAGWTGTGLASATTTVTIAAGSTGDRSYTATWTINNYDIDPIGVTPAGYGTVSRSSVTGIPYNTAISTSSNTFTVNGTTVTATPAAATAQYTYSFVRWNNVPATMPANDVTNITAEFSRTVNQYTILWKSEDGSSTLETDASQDYGATTSFGGSTPTKPATAQYTYTFDGWATEAGGAKVYNNGSTPTVTGNATYYAHFSATVNNYTVTIVKNEDGWGSVSASSITSVPYGTAVSTSTNTLTVTGKTPVTATPTSATAQYTYAFGSWTGVPATVTGNVTITANFTRTTNNYTVTFNMQGHGSAPSNQTVAYNGKVTQPSAPTATGYTFGGWYKEAGCTNAWNFSTDVITGDRTLYAKWTVNSYTVTLNTNGGTINAGNVTSYTYGVGATLPTNVTKDNYVFAGWYANSELTGDAVTTISTTATGNKTYWAKWNDAVAKVQVGEGTPSYYTTVAEAIEAANALTNPTVTILQTTTTTEVTITAAMTIDLNSCTVSSTETTGKKAVFNISTAAKATTVTIQDSGSGGMIKHEATVSGYLYGVYVTKGTLNVTGGTIYAKNNVTTNSSSYRTYAIVSKDSNGVINISGGNFEAYSPSCQRPLGICANGNLTMTGGTVIANGYTLARGIYVKNTTTSLTNVTVTATATNGYGYAIENAAGTLTIHSGTYTATGTSSTYAIQEDAGSVIIEDGKFSGTTKELNITGGTASISGGNYVHKTTVEDNCATNYYVFSKTLTEGGITYNWEVAEGYTLTWNLDGGEISVAGTPAGTVKVGATVTAPTVTKTGYTFSAWSPAVAATMPSADTEYTATWTPNTTTPYTVNHYQQTVAGDGWDLVDTDNLTGTTGASVTPAVKSYTGFTSPSTQTVTILADGSRVVTYNYTRNSYTLAWALDGGSISVAGTAAGSVKYGASLTAPTVTKTGYTFSAWSPTVPATMPAANSTYTATWSEKSYTVTFYNGGHGTVEVNGATVANGATASVNHFTTKTLAATASTGYTFAGWTKTGSVTLGNAANASTTITATATGGTVTATWTANTYNITYKDQGNVAFSGVHGDGYPTTHTYGSATALVNPTKTGYTFGGWYTTSACTGDAITSVGATAYSADFTLYAKWTVNSYTISFNSDGGSAVASITQNYGTAVSAPANPTKTGYTFTGWDPAVPSTMPAENMTCVAQWSINNYDINPIGVTPAGYGTVSRSSITGIPYNTAITVSSNTFTVNGVTVTATPAASDAQYTYTFSHWNNVPATMPANNVTNITAEFSRSTNTYTILWKSEDGLSTLETDASQEYGAATSFGGSTPTKPTTSSYTYTFDGWTTAANGGGTFYANGSTPTVSGAATYYAHFSATDNVASVQKGAASPTYHTTLADAFNTAKSAAANTTVTITVLKTISDITEQITYAPTNVCTTTLDLNGHEVTGAVITSNRQLLRFNKSGAILEITDGSTGGKLHNEASYAGVIYCVYVNAGHLKITGGTISAKNSKDSGSDMYAYAVQTNSSSTELTMTAGTVKAEARYRAYALYPQYTANISGGRIEATAGASGYAVGIYVGTPSSKTTTISGSVEVEVNAPTYAEAIRMTGTGNASVQGGTFNATSTGSYAFGIRVYRGTATVTNNPTFTIRAKTYAVGVRAGEQPSTSAVLYSGTAEIRGGRFDVSTTTPANSAYTNAYGVWAYGATRKVTASGKEGNYASAGTINVYDGTFEVNGYKSVYGIFSTGTVTSPDNGYATASATPHLNIYGGKFKVTGTTTPKAAIVATSATITNTDVVVQGGWYNIDTNLDNYVADTKDCNYWKLGLEGQSPYLWEVAEAYTLTWNLDGGSISVAGTPAGLVKPGTTLTAPTVTKTGYTFSAWSPAVAATMPSADTEYTATWGPAVLRFTTAGNWSSAANWTPALVPTAEHDVLIQKPCSVDVQDAVAKSIVIDKSESNTGRLFVGANMALNVTETIQFKNAGGSLVATAPNDLILESAAAGNASLIFNNSNSCQALVQMYSKAYVDGNWNWQYVGTPFTGTIANPNYAGSWLYKWVDATAESGGGWEAATNESPVEPWVGYCLSQYETTTLNMEGTLVATDGLDDVTRSFNTGVVAGTSKVLANSWTAPIQIKQMTAADFTNVAQTIFLFNTGFDPHGEGSEGNTLTAPGTYISIPTEFAGTDGIPDKISSMQGFYVKKTGTSPDASVTLNYGKHVRPTGGNTPVNGPMKAPQRDLMDKPQWMKIVAQGSRYGSYLYLVAREDFSYGFDNGWDGENLNSAGAGPLMYTAREDGTKDAISAIPEFEGAVVGFQAGEDSEYTFSFTYNGDEKWYLNDLRAWTSTLISAENTYTFLTTDDDETRFIVSATPLQMKTEDVDNTDAEGAKARKLLIRDKLYIILNGRIYDGTGKIVMDK